MKSGFLFFCLFSPHFLFSQSLSINPTKFSVSKFGDKIDYPFLGGINNPRIQISDINQDGIPDLFILNGSSELLCFISTENGIRSYLPILNFPVKNWFLLGDLGGDNWPDLLTDSGGNQVVLYRNTHIKGKWFSSPPENQSNNNGSPMQSESLSQPALYDFDNNGTLDFFSGISAGSILFYDNLGTKNQPTWNFVTDKFADILVLLDTVLTEKPEKLVSKTHHGASSVSIFDYENDGKPDLFFGDFYSDGIYYFKNISSGDSLKFKLTTKNFPSEDPVSSVGYNQTTFAVLDELPDLFVTVNLPTSVIDNFYFYKNIGSRTLPFYLLQTKNYISTLDVGKLSHVCYADFDHDGIFDFIISGESGIVTALKGTSNSDFEVISENWKNLTQQSARSPILIDIDGDEKPDLINGRFDGTLRGFKNTGTASTPIFTENNSFVSSKDFGSYSVPAFSDWDNDGDFDLAVGNSNGLIQFLKNTGTPQSPSFELLQETKQNSTFASPYFYDWNNDSLPDLISGDADGIISIWYHSKNGLTLFSTSPDTILKTEIPFISPAYINRSNGKTEIIAGCERGGIIYLESRTDSLLEEKSNSRFLIYPNPSRGNFTFELKTESPAKLKIYSLAGQLISEKSFVKSISLNLSFLSSGIYFAAAETDGKFFSAKLVLLK